MDGRLQAARICVRASGRERGCLAGLLAMAIHPGVDDDVLVDIQTHHAVLTFCTGRTSFLIGRPFGC